MGVPSTDEDLIKPGGHGIKSCLAILTPVFGLGITHRVGEAGGGHGLALPLLLLALRKAPMYAESIEVVLNGDSVSPYNLKRSSTDTGLAGTLTGDSNCIKYECGVSGPPLSLPESLSSDDELIVSPLVGGNELVGERNDVPDLLKERSPGR